MFFRYDRLTGDDTDDTFDLYLATLAPTAAAGDATDVTQTSATLNGTSGGDPAAKYHFELDGAASPEGDVPAGAGIKKVSTAVSGLTPDTTYRYKLVVTSSAGTTTSVERSFKTAAAPVSVPDNSGNNGGGSDDGGGHVVTPADPFAGVTVRGSTVKVKRGVVTLSVVCPTETQGACIGKITLKSGKRTIGTKSFTAKPGTTAKVRVRINGAGRKLLKKRRKITVSVGAVASDGRNQLVKTPARKLTLKR
jgi:hypothetical protein